MAAFHNRYSDVQEPEFVAQPAEGLVLRGGVGYSDAEFTGLNPLVTVTLDTSFVKTPEWSANAMGQYSFPVRDAGTVTIGADLSFRNKYYNETTNLEALAQDDVTVVGAFLLFRSPQEHWDLTVFGTNLGDLCSASGMGRDGAGAVVIGGASCCCRRGPVQ